MKIQKVFLFWPELLTVIIIIVFLVIEGFGSSELTPTLEALSYIAQMFLVLIAWRALRQITVAQEQNKFNERKLLFERMDQVEKFIREYEDLIKIHESKGYQPLLVEMVNYDVGELVEHKSALMRPFMFARKYYRDPSNPEAWSKILFVANKLEVIATALLELNQKDLIIIEPAISFAICNFVEREYYIYYEHRNHGFKLYNNTIKLYGILKKKIGPNSERDRKLAEGLQILRDNGYPL
jgi:hypothetical protein